MQCCAALCYPAGLHVNSNDMLVSDWWWPQMHVVCLPGQPSLCVQTQRVLWGLHFHIALHCIAWGVLHCFVVCQCFCMPRIVSGIDRMGGAVWLGRY
jgi:hypothetical protein